MYNFPKRTQKHALHYRTCSECDKTSLLLLLLLAFNDPCVLAGTRRCRLHLGALTILAQLPGGYPRVLFCRSVPYTAIAAPPRADSYHPWAAKPPRLSNGLLSGSRPGWRTLLAGGLWGGAAVAGTGGPCGTVGIGVLPAAGMRGARWAGEARCCRPRAVRRAEGNLGVRAWRCAQSCEVRLSRATVMAIGQVPLEAAFVCVRRGRAVSADDSKGADGGAAPEGG